jgi:hypothetical protein
MEGFLGARKTGDVSLQVVEGMIIRALSCFRNVNSSQIMSLELGLAFDGVWASSSDKGCFFISYFSSHPRVSGAGGVVKEKQWGSRRRAALCAS